jgi:hypothetical protein
MNIYTIMSDWLSHLKAFYNDKKKSNSSYSYKTAMKEAAKTFKRVGTKKINKNRYLKNGYI